MDEWEGLDAGALRRMLDRQAIVECIHRYARGVDRGDEELVRSAYHHDAVEDHGAYIGDVDGLVPFLSAVHRPYAGYQRYVTNITVEIDGEQAHAESYWLCVLRGDAAGKLMLTGGRYVDRLERRGGEWRIATRVVVSEWNGEARGGGPLPEVFVEPGDGRQDVSYQRPLTLTRAHRTPGTRRG